MREFDVTFYLNVAGKAQRVIRKVIGVKALKEHTAQNKAFRKICFYTKCDDWKFLKLEEIKDDCKDQSK